MSRQDGDFAGVIAIESRFFVNNNDRTVFKEAPQDITIVFIDPTFEVPTRFGDPVSPKTIEQKLSSLA